MRDSDSEAPGTDDEPIGTDDGSGVSRRDSLALLGTAGGLGLLAGCGDRAEEETDTPTTGPGTSPGGSPLRTWDRGVDAGGHNLWNVGSLNLQADAGNVRSLLGNHLTIDGEGALSVEGGGAIGLPDGIHIANEYPGDTLDAKLRAIVDELRGTQRGHRIVVGPPDPESPAAAADDRFWRFEEPVVIGQNTGKLTFDMGRTMVAATDSLESFFVIGPDEKGEDVILDGGYFEARGNLGQSFVDIRGIGHMFIYRMYLQSIRAGRNSVPAGIRLADGHGTSEVSVHDVEVTGCTDAFYATQTTDVPYAGAFDLDIYNFRGGGGEHAVRIDGGVGVNLHSIQSGGHPVQSVSGSIVKLENATSAVRKTNVSFVRERHNAMSYHAGVHAVDVDGGPEHDGIYVQNVDVHHADHGTDLNHVARFDQQNVRPDPLLPDDGSSGTSRWYADDGQVFDSTAGHEFRIDDAPAVSVDEEGLEHVGDGEGPIVTTPDGSTRYRIRVDDEGALVTEEVDDA